LLLLLALFYSPIDLFWSLVNIDRSALYTGQTFPREGSLSNAHCRINVVHWTGSPPEGKSVQFLRIANIDILSFHQSKDSCTNIWIIFTKTTN